MYTIGQDIEFFTLNKKDNSLVPAWALPLRKFNEELNLNTKIVVDNVACELNDVRPYTQATFRTEFFNNFNKIREFLDEKGLTVVIVKDHIDVAAWAEHPNAQVFGCDPFYCYYDPYKSPVSYSVEQFSTLRTIGGHIHIQTNNTAVVPLLDATALMFQILSLPFESKRGSKYGQAGAYRARNVDGCNVIEYRSLSPWWAGRPIVFTPILDKVLELLNDPDIVKLFLTESLPKISEMIQLATREEDKTLASRVLAHMGAYDVYFG